MQDSAIFRLAFAAMSIACSQWAYSQSQPENPQEGEQLQEVVVTAQKREERLQDVPMSITAIGEQKIERLGAENFEAIAPQVPSLTYTENGRHPRGGGTLIIRGVQLGGDAVTTAFYVGETPLQPSEANTSRLGQPDPNMYDISRIEVLKGPQGTLYGSSAMGGVVRVIPNAPDARRFDAKLDLDVNTLKYGGNGSEVDAMINMPLIEDRLAVRAVVYRAEDAGYVDRISFNTLNRFGFNAGNSTPTSSPVGALVGNSRIKDINRGETVGTRVALQWQATDRLTVTPTLFIQRSHSDAGSWISRTATEAFKGGKDPIDVDNGIREPNDSEFSVANLLVNWDLGFGQIVSSSTYAKWEWANTFDATGIVSLIATFTPGLPIPHAPGSLNSGPVGALNPDGRLISPTALDDTGDEEHMVQELRFQSSFDFPLNFLVGAFYRDVEQTFNQSIFLDPIATQVFGTSVLFNKSDERKTERETAGFLDLTWKPLDKLTVEGGLRSFSFDRRESGQADGLLGFGPSLEVARNQTGTTPSFSVHYAFNDRHMVFARAAQGYRRGFFSTAILPPACQPELLSLGIDPSTVGLVNPDKVWSYEVGSRGAFAQNRLSIGASAYLIDWNDVQVDLDLQCGFTLQTNAGKAEIKGVELETQAVLLPGLVFSAALGYTDAKVATDISSLGARKGDRLPGSYKLNGAAALEYSRPLMGGDYQGFARLDYTYTGSYPTAFSVSSFADERPALGVVNVKLGVDLGNGWETSIYAKNLANTVKLGMCGSDVAFRLVQPDVSTCINRSRTIGLHVRKSFGSGAAGHEP